MRRFSSLPCSLNTIAKRYSSDMAQSYVKRVTLFKVPKSEHIDEARIDQGLKLVVSDLTVLTGAQSVPGVEERCKEGNIWNLPCTLNDFTDPSQNGEPYIVSNAARKVLNTSSPLSEGYTIMSQSIFKNHSDHDFYDRECTAHKKLKVCDSMHLVLCGHLLTNSYRRPPAKSAQA
jgi:hypothetical protein